MPEAPYHRFAEFIAPGVDRFRFLCSILNELRLSFRPANIAGNRHLFLSPGEVGIHWNQYAPRTVMVAHYDRVPGSPGANDNSAAVFQLIETALRLRQEGLGRWLIIFTDKEELAHGEGIRDQGSYTLAMTLKNSGIGGSRYYIFDACGAGDTLIISTIADYLMRDAARPGVLRARRQVRLLRNRALETARELHMDRVLLAPTPFSDDAGFLRAGIAAQTITMLPAVEAAQFASLLRNKPDIPNALVSRDAQGEHSWELFPETWRLLNSPEDGAQRLTPEHYKRVIRFACELCRRA
jgi:hypothetical protein